MSTGRLRLGQLLVDARVLTAEQLDSALARQKTDIDRAIDELTRACRAIDGMLAASGRNSK